MLARKKLAALARKKKAIEIAKNPPPKPVKQPRAKALARKLTEKGPLKPLSKTYSHRDCKTEITRPDIIAIKDITPLKEKPKYSGGNLIGISLLHKSNYVPVFTHEESISITKMRRG